MNNKLQNKRAEILEIILIAIILALGINLISSGISAIVDIKNILVILIGTAICISVILYYLKIKIQSMGINKIVVGNIVLNVKNKRLYGILQYRSSYQIKDYINAILLENKEISNRYAKSVKNIENYYESDYKLQNSYFSYIVNSAIEYQIINLLIDAIYLRNGDIQELDLNSVPKNIADNVFVKVLSRDWRKRKVFINCDEEVEDEELVYLKTDEGYIYNKLVIRIPKNSTIEKYKNSLVVKSKLYKITIQWGIENGHLPFPDMEFYNFCFSDEEINFNDIEFSYFIDIKVEYSLLAIFSKKAIKENLWVENFINTIIEDFDYDDCLKRNSWELLKNIQRIKK